MKKYILLLFIATLSHNIYAQQVNGYFTPFAKNNIWRNTAINSVKIESTGSITLNGYYEGAWVAGFDILGVYSERPNKIPMAVRLNSNGTVQTNYGGVVNPGVCLVNYINTDAGSSVLDKSYQLSDGYTLFSGHWETGQGFLAKSNTSLVRPAAFNGGQILKYPVPTYTHKTYIEDWAVTNSITYTARMEGVTLTNHKVVVTAYNNTTGVPIESFGTNGSTTLYVEGWLPLEDTLPLKLSMQIDGTLYVAFTQRATAEANNIILYKLNSNGIVDSTFGHTVDIGSASFAVPRPFALTSLLLNTDGTITMGGYHATGDGNEKVSFLNYNNATNTTSSTSFNVPGNQVGVGTGSKATAAVLDNNGGDERTVFAVAFPFAPNRYRIFIQAFKPGEPATTLNLTPWQYPGAVSAEPTDIQRLDDGSFIVVGKMTRANGTTAGCVIKFNSDGTIDNSFGEQGSYILNGLLGGSTWADATQLANNKYLAVGNAGFLPSDPTKKALILNQFNSDGSIDTNFGTDGTVYPYIADYNREAEQVHALANGKFLIGGSYTNYQNEPGIGTGSKGKKATIYRFNEDGSPDSTFGVFNNGRYVFSGYIGLDFTEMQVIADTIYMGGNSGFSHTGNSKAYIAKLSPDGRITQSYLPTLTHLHTFTPSQVTGYMYAGGGLNGSTQQICKVKSNGTTDTSFGINGKASIPIVVTGENTVIKQIKLRPGYILVASEWLSNTRPSAVKGLFFTLISQAGVVDNTFGTGGRKFLSVPGAASIIPKVYKWTGVENDRLLIFGQAIVSGATKGFIAKVNLSGDLDATFGTGGVIWTTETFKDHIDFDNKGDMIAIQKIGFLDGGALAKLQIPADVYNRISKASWTGTINNDWFNAGNWAEAVIPDANTEVVIANGSVLIGASQHAFAYSVRVLGGATLTMGANSTLAINKNNP